MDTLERNNEIGLKNIRGHSLFSIKIRGIMYGIL